MKDHEQKQKPHKDDLTFYIRVQYRSNSSWQGTVQWMEGRKSEVFRSVLELGHLIEDARRQSSGEKDAGPRWEDKKSVS